MTQWPTLWRAGQLARVSRSVLQGRIGAGELQSNEGLVSTPELLHAYRQTELEDSGDFERVASINDTALARRVRERTLTRQAQRLFAPSQEPTDPRRHLQRYHDVATAHAVAADSWPPSLRELKAFAENGLAEVLATESADVLSIMDTRRK
jgi:hypothetical protein